MGVIKRQGVASGIFMYIGLFLGFLISAILIPRYFGPGVYGAALWFIDIAIIFKVISNFGLEKTTIRYLPFFRDPEYDYKGLTRFLFTTVTVGVVFSSFVMICFEEQILNIFPSKENSEYIKKYYSVLPLILLLVSYKGILASLTVAVKRPRVSVFLNDVLERVFVLLLIALFTVRIIDEGQFVLLYLLKFTISVSAMILFLLKIKHLNLRERPNFLKMPVFKEILYFTGYSALANSSSVVISTIDRLMVAALVSTTGTGIYAPFFFVANVIGIPHRGIGKITSPMISDAWKSNDLATIQSLYTRTALNNLAFGLLLFIGIWINIDHFVYILGADEYASGKYVALFAGLAQVFHLINGYNGYILAFSSKYRFDLISRCITVILIIITNYIFINLYGIVGAAIGTSISLFASNTMNQFFVYHHFKLHPFSKNMLYCLLIGAGVMAIGLILPDFSEIWYVDLIVQSLIVSIAYVIPIWVFNIAPDLINALKQVLTRFGIRI